MPGLIAIFDTHFMTAIRRAASDEESPTSALSQATFDVLTKVSTVEFVHALYDALEELAGRIVFQGFIDWRLH